MLYIPKKKSHYDELSKRLICYIIIATYIVFKETELISLPHLMKLEKINYEKYCVYVVKGIMSSCTVQYIKLTICQNIRKFSYLKKNS
jgi:hypothetical protein